MTRNKPMHYVTGILIVSGLVLFAHSGYFYTRGILVQILLEHLWEKSKRTGQYVRTGRWTGTYPVGRLRIKSIGLSRIVLAAANKESLTLGPAHISISALPGEHGNISIAGHRDSFFRNLKDVKRGEVIELESMSTVQYFLITGLQIADPADTHWIEKSEDDVITLITCYPFDYVGPAPRRYVVWGELTGEDRTD